MIGEKRRWMGLICPACRFVLRVPKGHSGEGGVCPACGSLFTIPKDEVTAIRPVNEPECNKDEVVVESEAGGEKLKFLASIAITLLAIVSVVVFVVIIFVKRDSDPLTVDVLAFNVQPELLIDHVSTNEDDGVKNAAKHGEVLNVIQKFFSESNISALGAQVRHPDITMPRMREYYQKYTKQSFSLLAKDARVFFDSDSPFVSVKIVDLKSPYRHVVLKLTEDGYRIDWESLVAWSEIDWEELIRERPSEEKIVRVICSKEVYYSGEYSDDDEWLCLKLEHRQSSEIIYGYILKESFTDAGLVHLLLAHEFLKMTLKIRYPEKIISKNQVVITEVMHVEWFDKTDESVK